MSIPPFEPPPQATRQDDTELRYRIRALSQSNPGLSMRRLATHLCSGTDRTRRLLQSMESMGEVAVARLRGAKRLFPASLTDPLARRQAVVLCEPELARLHELVQERPRTLDSAIRTALSWGWERSTTLYRLGVLEEVELVRRGGDPSTRYPPLHAFPPHPCLLEKNRSCPTPGAKSRG